jgi:CubicO group peptidase (beta-lactamase class C family)
MQCCQKGAKMKKSIQDIFEKWLNGQEVEFSGLFFVSNTDGVIYQHLDGYRNKAEELPNNVDTVFGIASGTKLFTGLAVCKLIDSGKLSLEAKLADLLPYDLGQIDERVTVFHLLTHTSGVGDYIDEESDDSEVQLQELYDKYPVQLWTRLEYYLQMITPLPPKFEPGERYGYSNSGYILLGLVIEAVSGVQFQQFLQEVIFEPLNLTHTGFFRMDSLPASTALGYIHDEETDEWRTNIFSLPIVGGSDGGLFTCAGDMDKLWRSVISYDFLSVDMTNAFLKSQVTIDEDGETYGLGVYQYSNDGKLAHFAVGGDSGVGFCTAYIPKTGVVMSCFSNTGWLKFYNLIGALLDVLG